MRRSAYNKSGRRGPLAGPAPGLPKLGIDVMRNLGGFLPGERLRLIALLGKLLRIVQSEEMRAHVREVIEYAEGMRT